MAGRSCRSVFRGPKTLFYPSPAPVHDENVGTVVPSGTAGTERTRDAHMADPHEDEGKRGVDVREPTHGWADPAYRQMRSETGLDLPQIVWASLLAAGLGGLSFVLPWADLIVSGGWMSILATGGQSPLGLLGSLLFPGPSPNATDPGMLTWERGAALGYTLWTVGAILFAVACVALVAQVAYRFRWAGVLLAVGAAISDVGILSFVASFPYEGKTATVFPGIGFFVGIVAVGVGLLPVLRQDPADLLLGSSGQA